MWNLIDKFLNDIAEDTGYSRDSLTLVAELCSGGPTVMPNSESNVVVKCVTAGPGVSLPSGWYDNIGSNHLEYRVIRTEEDGKITIPMTMYSFQHHPLAGCCRFAIQRWVRCFDATWSQHMQKVALEFRMAVAKHHGCKALFVSSGPSGNSSSGELYGEFESIFSTGNQSLYGMKL